MAYYHHHKGNKFTVVAIEYFTRWIEAKPLATITSNTVKKLFWQNIICRFGVPRTLTVDNGKQFDLDEFKEFCKSLGTTLAFASVYHPESNGAVERANRIVFSAISKTLSTSARGSGSKSYRWWCGLTTPQHLGKQASHRSNCYMERRQCC